MKLKYQFGWLPIPTTITERLHAKKTGLDRKSNSLTNRVSPIAAGGSNQISRR